MISLLNKNNPLAEEKNSISITYPRTVNIIFGHYPYIDVINNLIIDIKNNLNPSMKNYTNLKGGMTNWNYFIDKPLFKNFMFYLINMKINFLLNMNTNIDIYMIINMNIDNDIIII